MKKQTKIEREVLALRAELKANNDLVPESWHKYLVWLKMGLRALKIFTPSNVDRVIDQILEAIYIFEHADEC